MKLRTSFVSNSSSSSFIVFGARMPIDVFINEMQSRYNLTVDRDDLKNIYDSVDRYTFGKEVADTELAQLVCGKSDDDLYIGSRAGLDDYSGLDGDEWSSTEIIEITETLAKFNLKPGIFGDSYEN